MLENLITLSQTFGDNTATLDAALMRARRPSAPSSTACSTPTRTRSTACSPTSRWSPTRSGAVCRSSTPSWRGFGDASAAVFRAGNRGEFLNQKILCASVGPPQSSEAGCPTGDPITGLASAAQPFTVAPTSGSDAITSLLRKALDR